MTNNDDFDQPDYNPTEELPPKRSLSSNLTEAWRSRPLFKLMVLMIAVAAVVAASVSFFSGGSSTNNSRLVTPPSIKAAPGGPSSPYMQDQTNLANKDREQQALANGGSALPTPIGQPTDIGALNESQKKSDPLNALKAEVERLRQEQTQTQQKQAQQQQVQQQQPKQEQFDDSLAQAMQRQLSQLMDGWTPHGVKEVAVAKDDKAGAGANGAGGEQGGAAAGGAPATSSVSPAQAKALVQAGTVSYAQLLTEANSDVPGPILAQILSGPFAGARAVGQFQVANGYADYLVLQFTLVNFKGKDYPINGIALDPDTTLGGMATEVDQRYFTRVILPAAAGFMQGFGSALGTGSSSVVTNGTTTVVQQSGKGIDQGMFQGLSTGAQTVGQFFQNQANQVKPLVRVAAGTPLGLFFVASVMDTTLQQQYPNGIATLGAGYPVGATPAGYGGGYPGSAPYPNSAPGYPGTTVAGYGSQNANVPYPNYANQNPGMASPYSAFPTTIPQSYGPGYYGH